MLIDKIHCCLIGNKEEKAYDKIVSIQDGRRTVLIAVRNLKQLYTCFVWQN